MQETGLIPVFNHEDIAVAKSVLDASYAAGVRVFEFTNRDKNALEVFTELVVYAQAYPDLVLGIGTIFSREDAKKFFDAGARFIVSPALIPEVAHFCNGQGLTWIPGCGSVTEIYNALQLDAKVIKVFPGNVLGPAFVKSVRAVFPTILIMPTGGVTPTADNISSWFTAGANFVGMGSQLYEKSLIAHSAFDQLSENIKNVFSIIEEVKDK